MTRFYDNTKWLEIYDEHGEIVTEGSIKQVAKALRVGELTIRKSIKGEVKIKKKLEACEVGVMRKLYDAYRGDCFLGTGTIEELVEITGEEIGYVRWATYPASHNRAEKAKCESNQLRLFALEEPRIDYY